MKEGDGVYISEFWCGVAVTIIIEVVMLIVASIVHNNKKSRKGTE